MRNDHHSKFSSLSSWQRGQFIEFISSPEEWNGVKYTWIIHIWTAVVDGCENDHHSEFSNLATGEKPKKNKTGLQRDWNPSVTSMNTGAMLEGHGLKSRCALIFSGFFFQTLFVIWCVFQLHSNFQWPLCIPVVYCNLFEVGLLGETLSELLSTVVFSQI